MVISRQGRTYAAGGTGANVIGTYITFFENSRVPPRSASSVRGLTHARTTGTCLLLPPRLFRNYSFYLCDRLNARHGIYLGAYTCTYARHETRIRSIPFGWKPRNRRLSVSVSNWRKKNTVVHFARVAGIFNRSPNRCDPFGSRRKFSISARFLVSSSDSQ